ncbi:MAG: hypothetical protein K0S27_1147 [Gammaproteobacteria bacterium]|jgi:hypothetical protein|nr:hypothetical protein [Gammaproteobacteria bacterium]
MKARDRDIKSSIFVGEFKDDKSRDQLTQSCTQEDREENTLYVITDASTGKPYFSIRWPVEYRDEKNGGFNQESIQNGEWVGFGSIPKLNYLHQAENKNDSDAELNKCAKKIEWHLTKVEKAISDRDRLQKIDEDTLCDLFSNFQEKNITQFFGAKMLASVKKLRTTLFRGKRIPGQDSEQFDFKESRFEDVKCFAELVRALRETPVKKMSQKEASEDKRIQEIAGVAAQLEKNLEFRKDEFGLQCLKFLSLILGAILVAAPAALAGFKAGAALGTIVGGGVASVPLAMMGGGVGALLGGGFGLFESRVAVRRVSKRCAEVDYSVAINVIAKRRVGG